MRLIETLRLRLRSLFRGDVVERELDEELRYHLERQIEEHVARGLSPAHARREAMLAMGGLDQRKEECRDMRRTRFIEDAVRDLRYAVRMLRRSPGFTVVIVLSLALGIGANTAMFSAIDAVMLRLLPIREPHQLVMLQWTNDGVPKDFAQILEGPHGFIFPTVAYEEIRDHNDVFDGVFAFAGNTPAVNVGLRGRADWAAVKGVSGNYFDVLGVPAVAGRMLRPDDDRESAAPVAVVSHRFWSQKLGADPAFVGTPIIINAAPVTIVGVAPPEFFGVDPGTTIDVFMPLHAYAAQLVAGGNVGSVPFTSDPQTWWIFVGGRLKAGVTVAEAEVRANLLFERSLRAVNGAAAPTARTPPITSVPAGRGLDRLRDRYATSLLLLMGMVGLVLLIACANVAGLLLARASAREREIAIRLSLGAGPFRLVRQFLTESVLLALAGGAAGLFCAVWIDSALAGLLAETDTLPVAMRLDGRVLAFTAAISVLTGIGFGLAPAIRATRLNVRPDARLMSRKFLVSAQVAMCLLLLICAGLLQRTLLKLEGVDLGFERQQLVQFTVRPGLNGYKDARLVGYYDELQSRLDARPFVRSSTLSLRPAVGGGSASSRATIAGITKPDERITIFRHQVGSRYFETLGIPIVAGRSIGPQDVRSAPHVAIVNQTLVRKYFQGVNPIGHRIDFGNAAAPNAFEIVGVARDVKYGQLRTETPPVAYMPYQQFLALPNFMTFQVRGAGTGDNVSPLIAAIQREALAIDPNVPVIGVGTQVEAVAGMLALERTLATLSSFFGLVALALACVGLYGTMAYAVARRTREIGVRIALGARARAIQRMILRETTVMVVAGLVAGMPLALAAGRLLRAQLFDLSPYDPVTTVTATLGVLAVTILAGYIPARRASRVDAMAALRCE
jgi:predicted permease